MKSHKAAWLAINLFVVGLILLGCAEKSSAPPPKNADDEKKIQAEEQRQRDAGKI